MKQVNITTEYITLGQFLKLARLISVGGETKNFLELHDVSIDGCLDNRRGRKLYPGTKICILNTEYVINRQ